jgi:hypothetical protein
MSDHSITSLIEKLEGAEVGSTKLDCYVGLCARTDGKGEIVIVSDKYVIKDAGGTYAAQPYTTSLDAALALAERVGVRPYQADASIKGKWSWMVVDEARLGDLEANPYARATAATPALALCAAVLRAQSEAHV